MKEPDAAAPAAIPSPEEQFKIINGGADVQVRFADPALESEWVKVKKLSIREMPRLGSTMGDEFREVAFYVGKTVEWVESLEDDSFEALIKEGRDINFTKFDNWYQRQKRLLKTLGHQGVVDEALKAAVESASLKAMENFKR